MIRKKILRAAGLAATLVFLPALSAFAEVSPIRFSNRDKVLVIAPHPDDETLGAGGVIQSALEAKADLRILYLTHGDLNEMASIFYQRKPLLVKADSLKSGRARKKEAVGAMSVLGVDEKNLIFFGYPDFGTLGIWRKHWGKVKPFRSFLTRINKVLYKEDFSYGHYYRGDSIVQDLEKVMLEFKPTAVFVTAPFDLNSDHQAAYLFLNVALLDLQDELPSPQVYTYLIHAHKWPAPKKLDMAAPLVAPDHVSGNRAELSWASYPMDKDQVEVKRKALLKYSSQVAYSKLFMFSFVRTNELFLQLPFETLQAYHFAKVAETDLQSREVEYKILDKYLAVEIHLLNPLDEISVLKIELFGYKKGVPFASMPKLNLRFFGGRLLVSDGYRRIGRSEILYDLDLKDKRVVIKVPMTILKQPDYLFASAQTAKEDISLDFGSWEIMKIEP